MDKVKKQFLLNKQSLEGSRNIKKYFWDLLNATHILHYVITRVYLIFFILSHSVIKAKWLKSKGNTWLSKRLKCRVATEVCKNSNIELVVCAASAATRKWNQLDLTLDQKGLKISVHSNKN